MIVEIDQKSGFCFGVVNAISKAEKALEGGKKIYCLGDIVHNGMEVERLEKLGLVTINYEQFFSLSDCTVLLRAHGEPPSTYEYAHQHRIELIDATCPVVIKLQQRIKKAADEMEKANGQVVIFGKPGHAEVVGLNGQTGDRAIVVKHPDDLHDIDPHKPAVLFAQTTKPIDAFKQLGENLKQVIGSEKVKVHDTICRQVANRVPRMREFASSYDVVIFVGGAKSSNARVLFDVCRETNPQSYFISLPSEIDPAWLKRAERIGVCGATSTPQWLMEQVRDALLNL